MTSIAAIRPMATAMILNLCSQKRSSIQAEIQIHVIVLSIPDWGMTPFAAGRNTQKIAMEIDQFNSINREEAEKDRCPLCGYHSHFTLCNRRFRIGRFRWIAPFREYVFRLGRSGISHCTRYAEITTLLKSQGVSVYLYTCLLV